MQKNINDKKKLIFLSTMVFFSIALTVFVIILSTPALATKIISFQEQYQDYQATWHLYTNSNVAQFPLYIQNGTYATREEDSLALSIPGAIYNFNPDRISVTLNYTPAQINSRSTADGVNWYIPIPESLYKTRFYWDNVKPTVYNNTGIYLDSSNYWYDKSSGNLRFYYNQTARTFGINSKYVIFQFSTYVINNVTTSGFTTANVSMNGSRWTDDGQLALNLRNDSLLNMSGLVAYWSFDETQGTIIHNVNNESGYVNITNQGTWNGNATLNYTSGVIGNAGSFDGINDYVDTGTNLNISGQFTTILWWKSNTNSALSFAISDNELSGGGSNSKLGISATGKMFVRIFFGGSSDQTINAPSISTRNYIVLTRNSAGKIDLYVNSGVANRLFSDVAQNGNYIVGAVGRSGISSGQYFNGTIDEVRIYNRTLSAPEIAVLYNTSLRTIASPLILNQTANAGNIINRTRIVYTGQDSINNISIYGRQNGTTTRSLVQSNVTSNTWYSLSSLFNSVDFDVQLQGNGSNTPFFTSLEWDETSEIISAPVITNVTGNFFVNHSWTVSGGTNLPNLYNVSVNSIWDNTSFISFRNNTYSAHAWQNITVCGYDSINSFNGTCASQNTRIPNNIPVPIIIHATYLVDTGTTLNFSINATDTDLDSLTYSSNNTIGTFNTTTGNFTYAGIDADAGVYTFYFKVDDGYGGIVTQTTIITEESITQLLLATIATLPTKDDVSSAGTIGFLGGIIGGMLVIGVWRKEHKR